MDINVTKRGSAFARFGLPVLGFVLVIGAWELAAGVFNLVSDIILPAPSSIVLSTIQFSDIILKNLKPTLAASIIGFVAAVSLGFATALALNVSDRVNELLLPVVVGGNSVPRIAIAPLIIFYVDVPNQAHIIISAWVAYFPVVVNTLDGLNTWNESHRRLFSSLGATPWQEYLKVRLPMALPHIFDGMKVAATLAVLGAVVGEFVAAEQGMGFLALIALYGLNIPLAFATVTIMALISTTAFFSLYLLQDRVIFWKDIELVPT